LSYNIWHVKCDNLSKGFAAYFGAMFGDVQWKRLDEEREF
jgi:hypothetical protein